MLVFLFLTLAPGDPVSAFIRPELADNEAMRKIIIERYGLDQPLPVRYVRWLAEAVQGNLGYKQRGGGLPVAGHLSARPRSPPLLLMGTALADRHRGRHPARHDLGAAPVLEAGFRADRRRVPGDLDAVVHARPRRPCGSSDCSSASSRSGACRTAGARSTLPDFLEHLALPAMVLGFGYVAVLMRYTRASMLETHQLALRDDGGVEGPAAVAWSSCAMRSGTRSSRSSRSSASRCPTSSAAPSSPRACSLARASA